MSLIGSRKEAAVSEIMLTQELMAYIGTLWKQVSSSAMKMWRGLFGKTHINRIRTT